MSSCPRPVQALFQHITARHPSSMAVREAIVAPALRAHLEAGGHLLLARAGPDQRPMRWNPLALAAFYAARSRSHHAGICGLIDDGLDILDIHSDVGAPAGTTTMGLVGCAVLVHFNRMTRAYKVDSSASGAGRSSPRKRLLGLVDATTLWEAAWATSETLMKGPLGGQPGAAVLRDGWWRAVRRETTVFEVLDEDAAEAWSARFALADWGHRCLANQDRQTEAWLSQSKGARAAMEAMSLKKTLATPATSRPAARL